MRPPPSNSCCDRRPAKSARAAAPSTPTGPKNRILFVDDEPSLLRVLKLALRSLDATWEMDFANNGMEAMALLEHKEFDVVVTDMRMPGINGAQLLNHVLRTHPRTVRIVLSGYSDLSEVVNSVGLTHQFLEKPCSLADLKDRLERLAAMKGGLENDGLCNLIGGLKTLPSLPKVYLEITDALQSPTATTQRIAEIACQDPPISAKLLQLANSAYFGFSQKVYTVEDAAQLLGVSIIQSLSLAVPIFSAFSRGKCPDFPIDQIWEHSLQTGIIARRIAAHHLEDAALAEQAFCAGLLHDLGKIILADNLPAEYAAILKKSLATHTPLPAVEQEHFQTSHAEVGAYLLALWGLPLPLAPAVAAHHHPRGCGTAQLCLAGVIHLANALEHAAAVQPDGMPSPLDAEYLTFVGLDRQFQTWRAQLLAKGAEAVAESAC
jgi:HD-like signal output (HDOD) protein/ActR/RegA family two-component response regulator